jgi:hypothetical protein
LRWQRHGELDSCLESRVKRRLTLAYLGSYKKHSNTLKPHLKQQFVSPQEASAGFVAAMEDVLDVYHWPRNPDRPVVCLDETSKQLIVDPREPIAARPGQPERYDYEYERNGTANLFMLFAPLEGWRHVDVTDRHTAVDYAEVLKDLSDMHYPGVSKIVLVQDNLNTHKPASLYEAFPPRRRAHWLSGFSGNTRPSTAVGWIWRNPNSAC